MILKFLFRLSIEQSSTKVDLFKAVLNFPIDLAFLAISFAAIILTQMQSRSANPLATKEVLLWFVGYVVAAFVATLFARKSDQAFEADENIAAFLFVMPAYFIMLAVIVFSLQ